MKKIWQIDRRTFLRGFGAAVGLPMLDIMAPSLAHAQIATPKTRRLVWIYIPHGYIASAAKPDYLMNLLGDMRPNVSVVHGLRNEYPAVSQNGHFSIWAPFLNGVPTKNPAAVQTTFDQRIAGAQPAGSKVATLSINVEPADQVHDFNVQQANNPSFKGPNQPVPALSNPLDAYNRLFAGGAPVQADQRMAEQLKRRRGILHYTLEDSKKLMSKGSASDRIRLEEYFQGLSELDQRLLTQLGGGGGATCTPPAGVTNSANYGTRLQMFYDIAFFANLCDLTRVTTFMHAPENNATVIPANIAAPWLPRPLASICMKALSLAPEGRYVSARALSDDIERWLGDEPVRAHRERLSERVYRWTRTHRTLATSLFVGYLVATIAIIIGSFGWSYLRVQQEERKQRASSAAAVEAEDSTASRTPAAE